MTTPQGRKSLLTLHRLAEAYGRRPSEIAGIGDEWAAFQFDAAALAIGRRVENALGENAGKKKEKRRPAADIVAEIMGEKSPAAGADLARRAKTVTPESPEFEQFARVFGWGAEVKREDGD